MLFHTSNTTLRLRFFNFILQKMDILVKTSKTSNKACKWFKFVVCFENLISQIAVLEGIKNTIC